MAIVLSLISPKGGCGKSTAALTIATTLAASGARVSLVDGDPSQPVRTWSRGLSNSPAKIIGDVTESTIIPVIDAERAARDFVLVDVEGSANRMASRAIARSDLVIIPAQASGLDAAQAGRAVGLIREEEQVLNRAIAHRILLTRTSPAIRTRAQRIVLAELQKVGVPIFTEQLNEREAFKAMFIYRRALDELDPAVVNGLPAALENAKRLVTEIVAVLRDLKQGRAAA